MVITNRIICWLLIFQLSLPAWSAQDGPDQIVPDQAVEVASPEVIAEQLNVEGLATELESAAENSLPQKTSDTFWLTGQKLKTIDSSGARSEYDLSSLQLDNPPIVPANFERDVRVEINSANLANLEGQAGVLSLALEKNGQTSARHMFSGVSALGFARDKELLIVLDASGKLLAIDMAYARSEVFSGPLPMFEVGRLPPEDLKQGTTYRLDFIGRKVEPPSQNNNNVSLQEPITAGDLMVTANSGGTWIYDRSVIQVQVATGEAVLGLLSALIAPSGDTENVLKMARSEMHNPEVQERVNVAVNVAMDEFDPLLRSSLALISRNSLPGLFGRSSANREHSTRFRDRFTFEEWQSEFDKFSKKLEAEKSKTSAQAKLTLAQKVTKGVVSSVEAAQSGVSELVRKGTNRKSLKIMAMMATGGVTAAAAGAMLPDSVTAWGVHLTAELYKNYWPEVLKDQAYRITLLKSSLSLLAFIPILSVVGDFIAKAKGLDWNSRKMMATLGIRIYAAIQLPFFHHLAKIFGQPNIIATLGENLNPFFKVKFDSPLGKKLGLEMDIMPGVQDPLEDVRIRGKDARTVRKEAVAAVVEQRARVRGIAWSIAYAVVAQKSGIDPATLMAGAQEKDLKSLDDPEFKRRWHEVALELGSVLGRMESGAADGDISQLSREDLAEAFRFASQTAEKINARRPGLEKTLGRLKYEWRKRADGLVSSIANFGLDQYQFLKAVEPSESVYNQAFTQFWVDYGLAVVQMGLIGERADLAHPEHLAANSKNFLWTTPGHRADMIDQVRIYGINVPASLVLNYQKLTPIEETAYEPVENERLKGKEHVDGFFNGMRQWTANATNLVKADYGAMWANRFIRSVKTMQAGILMVLLGRMLFAGQSFGDAIAAWCFWTVWGTWGYGWMWEPVLKGNIPYETDLKKLSDKLKTAQAQISQGVRVNDLAQVSEGYSGLVALYKETPLDSELEQRLIEARALFGLPSGELSQAFEEVIQDVKKIEALQRAVFESGSHAQETAQAVSDLQQSYRDRLRQDPNALTEILRLNAKSLLDFSLKTPPFATKPHPGVSAFTNMVASIATTYLATGLSVLTYSPNVNWGELMAKASVLSALLYATTYFVPRLYVKAQAAASSAYVGAQAYGDVGQYLVRGTALGRRAHELMRDSALAVASSCEKLLQPRGKN